MRTDGTHRADDDPNVVAAVTAIVREADLVFERVGGSSRHWVRDCFLPLLNQAGWVVTRAPGAVDPPVDSNTGKRSTREEKS